MRYRSLTSKLLAVYMPLVLFSLIALFAVQGIDFYYQQRAQLIEKLQQVAEIQSKSAAIAVWEFDTGRLMATAREIGRLAHIQGFRIQDETGMILAESGNPDLPVDYPEFLVTRKIVLKNGDSEKLLGTLTVTGNSDFIWQDLRAQAQAIFFNLLVLLLALVGATLLANRLVIGRPIRLLHQSIIRARTEGVSQKVEWQGNDELAQVVSAYNELLDAQKKSDTKIKQYQDSLEQQVNERTEELRKVVQAVEQSPLCVVITDVTGIIEHVNPTFTKVTGYESHEVIGKNSRVLKSGETLSDLYESLWETILSGKVWQSEIHNRKKNGKLYWASISIAPVTNDEGAVTHFVAMIDDISRAKKAEDEKQAAAVEIKAAKELAEQANQAKSAFLAAMSHELRTPMNAILGYSEMLIEEAEDTEQEDFIPDLKKINQAGTHLLALINDVLDLSKIESGKMEAFAENINLDSLIDEVAATAHPLLEKNGNQLIVERGKNLSNAFQDITKLRQMLLNLMSNAAKFTKKGTVTLHANRVTKENGDWLTLAVSDTGIGIAEDKLDHVFDEFTQADSTTTRDYGGTGLGLSITRRFCKLLGGELSVHSTLGAGSTFTISIPADLPGSKPPQQTATTPVEMTEALQESIQDIASGSSILVIDDDPRACELIERNLTKDGFSVVTATSGEQGLRLAHDIQPAAITLDVVMPDMDGWSVLRALKADPVLRHIPVIMLTMMDDRSRGYSLGAVDYLTKPVDREQLRKTLSRYYRDGKSSTVMLVEDDLEIRDMMARTLKKAGWDVSEAGNGQEALDLLAVKSPDLILLDLMMPVMDGFGFLAEMRVRPDLQHIPVIVVTAMDLTPDDRQRLSGQVEQVLEKSPYTREQLLEYVRDAVVACNVTREANTEDENQDEQDTAG
jgi:PAS domain S-box-containing protein